MTGTCRCTVKVYEHTGWMSEWMTLMHGTWVGVSGLEEKVVTKIYAVFRPGAYKEGVDDILPNRVWPKYILN